MKILIGEISSYKAIVIARHIKTQYPDVDIWGYDCLPGLKWIHTRYVDHYVHLSKTHDKEQYIRQLSQCALSIKADKLIPVHSDYIGDVLAHKDLFGTTLDYMGSYDLYRQLHEKDKLMSLAKELGVRIPINYNTIEEAQVPFVVKPTALSSAKGVRYCMHKAEKMEFSPLESNTICQEYIEGQGCGFSVYCKDGKILKEYGHLRLAEYPISGGSSVYRCGFVHNQMRKTAEIILSKVPWTGFAMFEFKLTPSNEVVLIEVNPRIWGSINQALSDGCMLFDNILKHKSRQSNKTHDVQTCLWPQVIVAGIQYGFKGDWSVLKSYLRNHVQPDVSIWNDPKGFFSMIIRKLL